MQFKSGLIIVIGLLLGCAKSEKLNDDEMNYIKLSLAMTRARIASHDSVQLAAKLDSVYKKFETTEGDYKKQTVELSKTADRTGIIFRALADSLNVK